MQLRTAGEYKLALDLDLDTRIQTDGQRDSLIPVYPRKHSFCGDVITLS